MNKFTPINWTSNIYRDKVAQFAYFQGAKRTRLNRDFAINGGHFESLAAPDRALLRDRARWLSANNPICSSIDNSIIKNVIGSGIKLQSKIKDKQDLNEQIEERWREFCLSPEIKGNISMAQLQELILRAEQVDGEILIRHAYIKGSSNPYKVQLIESDLLDENKHDEKKLFSGIEVDEFGRAKKYHISKGYGSLENIAIDSSEIIHFFNPIRASQLRGISAYAKVINDLKDFAAYNEAVITKERANASLALFVTSPTGGAFSGDSSDGITELSAGMIKHLRPGEDIRTLQPTNIGSTYPDFISTAIRIIAAGRDCSYELAFRDYSKTNYSSARASLLQDHATFNRHHERLSAVLSSIFSRWLDAEVMSGNIAIPDYENKKGAYKRPFWIRPRREWTDPQKMINATEKEIKLGLTTRTRVCAELGVDFEDVVKELAREQKMLEEAGLLTKENM